MGHDLAWGLTTEWHRAREHLVDHAGQAVDVAPAVEVRRSGCLLRAHVRRCSHREPDRRSPVSAGQVHRARHAEVGDERMAVREQDVLRLDVPVDHAARMGVIERTRDIPSDAQGYLERQSPLALKPSPEGLALHVRHHEPEAVHAALTAGGGSAVEQGKDVGVLEAGDDTDLAEEPLRTEGRTDFWPQYLQRNLSGVPEILREIHSRHTALADESDDLVPVAEGRFKPGKSFVH